MTTVLKNRAVANPDEEHFLLFHTDLSGTSAYADAPNVTVRIVPKGRYSTFTQYITNVVSFDEIRVISLPEIPAKINGDGALRVIYEFHTSDEGVIDRELELLDRSKVSDISVPSLFLQDVVCAKLPFSERGIVSVTPNLVDRRVFCQNRPPLVLTGLDDKQPLVWIGRFDKGKNARDFLRVLSLLPPRYHGILIVSFETQPERISDLLSDASHYGLSSRLSILLNLSQDEIAGIYRFAAKNSGVFCSTSLGESFGYGVAEALASGLPTVAYEVGALPERAEPGVPFELVPVGGIHDLADCIISMTSVQTVADR